jgi:hypothetical protein
MDFDRLEKSCTENTVTSNQDIACVVKFLTLEFRGKMKDPDISTS